MTRRIPRLFLQRGATRAPMNQKNLRVPICAEVLRAPDDFAAIFSFLCLSGNFTWGNDAYRHFCMVQNSSRNRSQKHASETTSLVSSNNDQIDVLSAGHFE